MVVVYVVELLVLEDVELDAEGVVVGFAVVGAVEEAEVLRGASAGDAGGGDEDEDEAVAGEGVFVRSHGEDEGGGEGKDVGGVVSFCGDFGRV